MKRSVIYIVILGIVCVGLGIVAGMAVEKRYTAKNFLKIGRDHFLRHSEERPFLRDRLCRPPKERLRSKICDRIDRELDLSSEQKTKVKSILEKAGQEIDQARDKFRDHLIQAKKRSDAQILEILSPEQKKKFQKMRLRRRWNWRKN